jgi:hypothetical protein
LIHSLKLFAFFEDWRIILKDSIQIICMSHWQKYSCHRKSITTHSLISTLHSSSFCFTIRLIPEFR